MPGANAKCSRDNVRTILVIDIGGNHVKMGLSKPPQRCKFKSGPKGTAKVMCAKVNILTKGWTYQVVPSVYRGLVAGNRPIAEPCNLGSGWAGFDFANAFHRSVKVVNDAVMQATGSYRGGRMLFLGLGTGLGSALIMDGVLEPMELAHLPYKTGKTFEDYVGAAALKRQGEKKWKKSVMEVVAQLKAALQADHVVLGGGNAKRLTVVPRGVYLGDNSNACEGGFRLWQSEPA